MGTYRKEWDCCGSVTETQAWEPEECPFCATPPSPSTAPRTCCACEGTPSGNNNPCAVCGQSSTATTVEVDERAAVAVGLRLPALPRAVAVGWKGASMAELADGYTARQMRAYGEACARAALASKPLAREADQQPMKGTSE